VSKDWAQDVTQAVQEIAAAADSAAAPRPVTEEFGEVFTSLGKAAGHADRLASSGAAGRTAREHFRRPMVDVGKQKVRWWSRHPATRRALSAQPSSRWDER
jgi:hypothetical protein